MRRTTRLGLLGIAVLMAACGGDTADDADVWGGEAVVYFDELASAYSENDYYGVLDFYDVETFVEIWRGDMEGGMLVYNYLQWNSGDLGRTVRNTYVGRDAALTLVEWETANGLSVVYDVIDDGVITHEVIFDHGAWLEQGFRSAPEYVAAYEDVYERFGDLWSDDTTALSGLYHTDIVLSDPAIGGDIRGLGQLETTRGWSEAVATLELSSATITGLRTGPAVFQGPAALATDPERAVGLYEVTDPEGCVGELAVVWELEDGLVVDEVRLWSAGSFDDCDRSSPEGWWSGLGTPGPSEDRVTAEITTTAGDRIAVHNGTPRLEELVTAGLTRFGDAGLEVPRFDSVTFEPTRSCVTRSGRLLQNEDSRDLFICLYESDLCPGTQACTEGPGLNVRSNVLHELGHAWILDHVDADEQQSLLEVSGRDAWDSTAIPWSERGVEYAAEVIAWGLLEETAPMVRIGRPSCRELASAFEALTHQESPFRSGACTGS